MSSFSNVTYMQHPRAYRASHRALSPRHHLPSRVQPSPPTRPYPRDCASAQTSHRDSLFPTFYFSFTRMARSSARPHSSFNPYLPLRTRGEQHPASHHRGSLLFLLPLRELAAEHGGIRLSALRPLRPHAAALSAVAAPSAPRSPRRRRRSRRSFRPFEAVFLFFFVSRRIAADLAVSPGRLEQYSFPSSSLAGLPRTSSPSGARRRPPRGFRRRRARSAGIRAICGCRGAFSWLWRGGLTVEGGRRAAGRTAAPRAAGRTAAPRAARGFAAAAEVD